jgi:hypothetical protein
MNLTPIVLPCRQTTSQSSVLTELGTSLTSNRLGRTSPTSTTSSAPDCDGAQAAFVVRQTMGRDPRGLGASPPNFAFDKYASRPVHTPAWSVNRQFAVG